METSRDQGENVDIFQLLGEASEKRRRDTREQLLKSIDVKEFFDDGSIRIDTSICDGVECKLCIEACPTNALYWGSGKVNVVEELCVFCTACVLSCIVDDCIRVKRKRPNGNVEEFSNPREALMLLHEINARRKRSRVQSRMEWGREIPPSFRMYPLPSFLRRYRRSRP